MTHSILNQIYASPTPTTTRDLLLSYLHKMPLEFLAFLNLRLDDGLTLENLISSVKMDLNLNAIMMFKDSLKNKKESLLSPSKIKLFQRTELSMLEFLQEINSMTLNAKNNISINDIQTMILSLTLLAVSTSTDRALDRYWTEHYKELSNRLWLPTKIASAASGSILSTTYSLKNATSNSWFSITKNLPHKKNWSQTSFPSSPYLAPEPMDSENTNLKSNKISIYPTLQQKKLLKHWFGLSRWFYNRSIEACELFQCYDPVKIKSIVNGATPTPTSQCLYVDEAKLLEFEKKIEECESKNKPITTLQDYSLCSLPCDGDYCSNHIPASSQCSIINTIIPNKNIEKIKLVPCLKPCEGEYCPKHIPRLKCRVKQSDGSVCQEYCKLDSTVCYRHQDDKRKDQYKDVIPPWYVDLNIPYVPRFITGSIVDCCKSYKSSFGLFNSGHIDKFNVSQRTKKDRYQGLVIEKTCFSSDNIFLSKYFKSDALKFGVFHTKHHKQFKFKQLQLKYDGRLIWDSKLDKWYYIYTSEKKKANEQRIENQDALPKPSPVKRLIAIDLGIKTPGTGYSPNGHLLTLDIHQPTEDILAQIEQLTSLDKLSRNQKRTLKSLQRRYKYRNDMGGELYGYLLAQDRLRGKIEKTSSKQKKKVYWKVFYRLSNIIKNKVDDFHWRCIRYLTENYDCISVGNLKIKQIIKCLSNSNQRKSVRILTVLRMSKFVDRLKEKCKEHQKVLHIQNEACTSKTCSGCGWYNETLGRSRTFICLECNLVIDRDVNAARNIYLRSWLENGLEFRYPMHASASLNKGVSESSYTQTSKMKENHRDECFK